VRALWLALGGRTIASSRVRAFEMSDALNACGNQSRVVPAAGVAGRLRTVWALRRRWDVVVLQKLLYGPAMLRLVRWRSETLIFECDDAIHLGYPGELPSAVSRNRRRLSRLLASVDLVTTSNQLLAEELRPRTGKVVWFAGPAPQRAHATDAREPALLLWLGSPSTTPHLELLGSLPSELRSAGWSCVAVGASRRAEELGWTVVPWTEAIAAQWLGRATVGIMPQRESAWDDRKAAYKVLQYAAAGVVPVASDVLPARALMAEPPLNDLLVSSDSPWAGVLVKAQESGSDLQESLALMAARHSLQACIHAWLSAVQPSLEK
jgi:hypothetical protein